VWIPPHLFARPLRFYNEQGEAEAAHSSVGTPFAPILQFGMQQQRRISGHLLPLAEFTKGDDTDLLVPRLLARVAQLEHKLYMRSDAEQVDSNRQAPPPPPPPPPSQKPGIFSGLLRAAGMEPSVTYIIGEEPACEALTQEATSKALLITVRKFKELKRERDELQDRLERILASQKAEGEGEFSSAEAAPATPSAADQLASIAHAPSPDSDAAPAEAHAAEVADLRARLEEAEAEVSRLLRLIHQLRSAADLADAVAADIAAAAAAAATAPPPPSLQPVATVDGSIKSSRAAAMQELHATR
jgi:hypothetical protein